MSLTVLSNTDMRSDCAVCAIFRHTQCMSAKKKSRAHSDLFKKYLLHLGLAQTWTRTHKNFLQTNLLELRLTKILLTRTQTQTQALSDFVSPSESTHHEFVDLRCYGKILNTGASSLTALDSHPVQRCAENFTTKGHCFLLFVMFCMWRTHLVVIFTNSYCRKIVFLICPAILFKSCTKCNFCFCK